ncbi:MAG: alternative ribosome rescue aminoacyl-tRNA hydrolase ArfB [Planctomycetia bacterium]|jgi:ribosome-associated protein
MAKSRGIRVGDAVREVVIPADALEWQFVRSSGPGGQHVNRTSSKAILRFDAARSPHLPDDVRRRLLARERSRLTDEGWLIIVSQAHREQPRNAADCLAKLSQMIERALVPPKTRRRTKTPRAAVARRLEAKQRRSRTKHLRSRPEVRRGGYNRRARAASPAPSRSKD